MSEQLLNVEVREKTGKGISRRLRAEGRIPGVVYGKGMDAVPVSVDLKEFGKAIAGPGGRNHILTLNCAGELNGQNVIVSDLLLDSLKGFPRHVDLHKINLSDKVKVHVRVALVGTAIGVKAHALQRAKEASSLASGASFRAWWAALLQETQLFERPRGGVALLSAKLASGRRFAKVYLMHAVKGAYTVGEGEDYFVPEEAREALEWVFARLAGGVPRGGRLPRRFLGRDRALHAELLARGARLVVTCPEADQDGPLAPEPGLVGAEMSALPPLPTLSAASRLELAASACYRAGLEPVELGEPRLEALRRHQECGFRYWAERRLPREEEAPWWLELLGELRRHRRLNKARLALLQERFPQAAPWLAEQAPRLLELQFDVPLPEDEAGPRARLDAVRRRGDEASLYRFTAPGRVQSEAEASDYLDGRWNELWAAGHLLSRYQGRLRGVWLLVWPLLGEPVAAYGGAVTYLWKRVVYRQQRAQAAYVPFGAGEVRPNPGYRCRGCRVADLCREAGR